MAKLIQINSDSSDNYRLIGIASDERIWKLCHEINMSLGIEMKRVDTSLPVEKPISVEPNLFQDASEEMPDEHPYYEDIDSEAGFTYSLFTNKHTISPKKVRAFRYFFLIRDEGNADIRIEEILKMLHTSPSIRTAVDISDATNLNEIIH